MYVCYPRIRVHICCCRALPFARTVCMFLSYESNITSIISLNSIDLVFVMERHWRVREVTDLHEDRYTFITAFRLTLSEWEWLRQTLQRNQNTRFAFSIFFLFSSFSNRAVYEIMCKNTVGPDRPLRIACRIPKTTNTHSEYVKLFAVPLQQLFGRPGNVLDDWWNHCSIRKRAQPSVSPKRELRVFWPSPYLCNEYREFLSPIIKRLGPEGDISPLSSSEIKIVWIHTTISFIHVHGMMQNTQLCLYILGSQKCQLGRIYSVTNGVIRTAAPWLHSGVWQGRQLLFVALFCIGLNRSFEICRSLSAATRRD